jgi:hypothetical protein
MSDAHTDPLAPVGQKLLASCQSGLTILLAAVEAAKELHHDVWDFAVEIHNLCSAGLTSNNLRWLLCMGYADHAIETTRPKAARRTFQAAGNLMLCERSCFVLTPAGVALARGEGFTPRKRGTPAQASPPSEPRAAQPKIPRWDAECRELRWGAKLVKRFRVPALNQELVLAAFEEEGWPPHLDDPLPKDANYDAKQRLQDTIKRLNRHQVNRLLHFRGDGSGTGILWELWS